MTTPDTDHYYADRLHRRDVIAEELETWVDEVLDEVEADEADDDEGGDY